MKILFNTYNDFGWAINNVKNYLHDISIDFTDNISKEEEINSLIFLHMGDYDIGGYTFDNISPKHIPLYQEIRLSIHHLYPRELIIKATVESVRISSFYRFNMVDYPGQDTEIQRLYRLFKKSIKFPVLLKYPLSYKIINKIINYEILID